MDLKKRQRPDEDRDKDKPKVNGHLANGDAVSVHSTTTSETSSAVDDTKNGDREKNAYDKLPLSKQPSNGIHVMPPDGQTPVANGALAASYGQSLNNGEAYFQRQQNLDDMTFDPNDDYYLANPCCELMHYRTAAIVVGVLEMALLVGWILAAIFYYYVHGYGGNTLSSKLAAGGQNVAAAVFIVIIIIMLVGILTERPVLLWPHMVVQIAGIAFAIALTIIAVIAMCAGTSLAETLFSHICGEERLPLVENALGPIWPFCLAVIFDFAAALRIWFYIVTKGCYEYLMDKKFFEAHSTHGGTMATTKSMEDENDNDIKKPVS